MWEYPWYSAPRSGGGYLSSACPGPINGSENIVIQITHSVGASYTAASAPVGPSRRRWGPTRASSPRAPAAQYIFTRWEHFNRQYSSTGLPTAKLQLSSIHRKQNTWNRKINILTGYRAQSFPGHSSTHRINQHCNTVYQTQGFANFLSFVYRGLLCTINKIRHCSNWYSEF